MTSSCISVRPRRRLSFFTGWPTCGVSVSEGQKGLHAEDVAVMAVRLRINRREQARARRVNTRRSDGLRIDL